MLGAHSRWTSKKLELTDGEKELIQNKNEVENVFLIIAQRFQVREPSGCTLNYNCSSQNIVETMWLSSFINPPTGKQTNHRNVDTLSAKADTKLKLSLSGHACLRTCFCWMDFWSSTFGVLIWTSAGISKQQRL